MLLYRAFCKFGIGNLPNLRTFFYHKYFGPITNKNASFPSKKAHTTFALLPTFL